MGKVELKEGARIRGIKNTIIDGGGRRSSCNNEKKNERSYIVLAGDITYDNHWFPVRECDGYRVEQSRGYLQQKTASAIPSSFTVDTRAIQYSELLRKFEETSHLSVEQKKVGRDLLRYKEFFTSQPGQFNSFQY